MKIDISDISADFPDFRVAVVVATDLDIPSARPQVLAEDIAAREAECRARWMGQELSAIPGIAVWRAAYRAFGIRKTSYRCSVERLVKNVLADRSLPEINAFVDAYNAVSLSHVMPLGADDLDRIAGDLAFRYSREGDTFLDMAGNDGGQVQDPPKPGEVVYADGEKVLCRRWNWRQDARSLVTPATRRAIVTVQHNGAGDLEAAVLDLTTLLKAHTGAECCVAIADSSNPAVSVL